METKSTTRVLTLMESVGLSQVKLLKGAEYARQTLIER